MKYIIILSGLLLAGCKPPKFNENIVCPTFHAEKVAIYEYSDANMFYVLYPNYSWAKIEKTECLITLNK